MFSRLDTVPVCDGQTDGWTDNHLDGKDRASMRRVCRKL